jgi:chemotaxis signal transduction protein
MSDSTSQVQHERPAVAEKGGKYLTFALANEEYGLEILKVREIIGYMDITVVPQMPHFVKGIINLRGQIIPVIELRTRFELEAVEVTKQTCIMGLWSTESWKFLKYSVKILKRLPNSAVLLIPISYSAWAKSASL